MADTGRADPALSKGFDGMVYCTYKLFMFTWRIFLTTRRPTVHQSIAFQTFAAIPACPCTVTVKTKFHLICAMSPTGPVICLFVEQLTKLGTRSPTSILPKAAINGEQWLFFVFN